MIQEAPGSEEGPDEADKLLTPLEVQQILGLSRSTVYRLLSNGLLPTVRIQRSVRVPLRLLREWIKDHTRPGCAVSPGGAHTDFLLTKVS
jgi:excisionase family DNA binding protein